MSHIETSPIESAVMAADSWKTDEVLSWAFSYFGDKMEIASAFGAEGIVLLDLAHGVCGRFKVFTIDTGFLFPETRQLIQRIEERYRIKVQRLACPLTPRAQEEVYGAALWGRDPNLCCAIRKVGPLRAKLSGLRAWMTAIRREQTSARVNARKIEWDSKFGCWKINPLADWTGKMVWDHIRSRGLDYNPLHDQNYPSVGCIHCTRAVLPGEDPRAGRWPGFSKTECGLHEPPAPLESEPRPTMVASGFDD